MADKGLSKQEKQRLKEKQKFERERAEWKKQEARKRTKKSGKKDRTGGIIRLVAILVAVVVVIGIVSIYGGSYGVPGRYMPALTVGSQNVSAPEWAFNFSNLYRTIYPYGMYYGLNTSTSLFGQPLQGGGTWDESLRRQVHQSLQNEIALYSEAKKAGFKLSEEDRESLEQTMKELEEVARMYAMSVGAYLRANYVPGITKPMFRKLEERKLVVQGFVDQLREEYRAQHPMAELQEKYDADPAAYNQADFRVYAFAKEKVEPIAEETSEDDALRQAEADAAALKKAEGFLAGGGTQAGFIAAAQALYDAQHQHGEDEELDHAHDYDADADTLSLRKRRAETEDKYGEDFAAWVFGAARRAGETKALETDSSVYAVLMVRPSYAQTTVDFYTINVELPPHEHAEGEEHDEDEPTPQALAKQDADELYAQWQEDGGTLEAFIALVNAQTIFEEVQEGGQPGFSEKMAPGDSGVSELDAWAFDPARKAGDAAVIEYSGGCKLVYLSACDADSFAWHREIEEELVDADYTDYVVELQKEYPMGHHGIGMRFALASARKMCDEFMEYQKQQSANNYDYYDYGY